MIKRTNNYHNVYDGFWYKECVGNIWQTYCTGEITNIYWSNYNHQELIINIKLFEKSYSRENATVYANTNGDQKFPFQIGDIILFEAREEIYMSSYARKRGMKEHSLFTNSQNIAIVNHIKDNEKNESINWIEKLIEKNKYWKLCSIQQQAFKNQSLTMTECVNTINQEMNNESESKKQKVIEQFTKNNNFNQKEE